MTLKIKLVLASLFFVFCANAQSVSDSSANPLLASAFTKVKTKVVLREANVTYPTLFADHKDESKDYTVKYSREYRNHLISLYRRSSKYFPKVKSILKKHSVPAEFAVLMAIESGFNAKIISPAGAVGWWQIMDATAKELGLKIIEIPEESDATAKSSNKPVKAVVAAPVFSPLTTTPAATPTKKVVEPQDDRWNLGKATTAAAKYLKYSYRQFGDWLLVAAAYNCGGGRVKNAMAASGKANPTFWDVKQYLPLETRNYVMRFISMNVLFKNANAFIANDLIFDDIMGDGFKMVPLEPTEKVL